MTCGKSLSCAVKSVSEERVHIRCTALPCKKRLEILQIGGGALAEWIGGAIDLDGSPEFCFSLGKVPFCLKDYSMSSYSVSQEFTTAGRIGQHLAGDRLGFCYASLINQK